MVKAHFYLKKLIISILNKIKPVCWLISLFHFIAKKISLKCIKYSSPPVCINFALGGLQLGQIRKKMQ